MRIERDQASQISAWCIALVDNDDQVIDRGLLIHNSSSTPVYDVEVDSTYAWRSTDEPKPRSMFRMGVLPPGDFITTVTSEYDGWSFPDSREIFELKVRPVTKSKAWSVTALRFTDAQGLPWGRTGRYLGRL
ncbi:hypothetical protein AXK61_07740 [Tsukamurella pseudospumae]|uniref:Uncharacterized protein n=1 Tax=Tsukamurella pseudospumae TaxID=239498 RepID=A0A137YX32_9ACTN|nr:hypothetical protein AXK61_07740 [Tsukamurella pseudospumae]